MHSIFLSYDAVKYWIWFISGWMYGFLIPIQSILSSWTKSVCTSMSGVFQRAITFYQDSRYQTDYYMFKHISHRPPSTRQITIFRFYQCLLRQFLTNNVIYTSNFWPFLNSLFKQICLNLQRHLHVHLSTFTKHKTCCLMHIKLLNRCS